MNARIKMQLSQTLTFYIIPSSVKSTSDAADHNYISQYTWTVCTDNLTPVALAGDDDECRQSHRSDELVLLINVSESTN